MSPHKKAHLLVVLLATLTLLPPALAHPAVGSHEAGTLRMSGVNVFLENVAQFQRDHVVAAPGTTASAIVPWQLQDGTLFSNRFCDGCNERWVNHVELIAGDRSHAVTFIVSPDDEEARLEGAFTLPLRAIGKASVDLRIELESVRQVLVGGEWVDTGTAWKDEIRGVGTLTVAS